MTRVRPSGGRAARGVAALACACCLWLAPARVGAEVGVPIGLESCAAFTSYAEIVDRLAAYEADHPAIARALVIGTTVEGLDIPAIVISADPGVVQAEPAVRIDGGTHGDECLAVEAVLAIIDWLVAGYGADADATALVDGAEILCVPVLNADGYAGAAARRANANGVDLNRNFGFAWLLETVPYYYQGPGPFSELETRAFRDAALALNPSLGLSYHTPNHYVNGPWNWTPYRPPDEALIEEMGSAYAGGSTYDVVFGWEWVWVYGGSTDWAYTVLGALDWTIEIRSDTEMEWPLHLAGLRALAGYLFQGVRGTVTDARTGEPLSARLTLDPPGAPFYSSADLGTSIGYCGRGPTP